MPAKALRIITSLMGTFLLLGILAVVVLFLETSYRVTSTPIYKESLDIARSSPDVKSVLGGEITPQWPVIGFDLPSRNSEFAQWSVKLKGPSGVGHLYVVANRVRGFWEYSRLVFVSADRSKKFDLVKVPRLSLPEVPSQHVYVVPLDLLETGFLDWAPAYYRAKFGIDVTVLPPAKSNPLLEDSKRHQVDAGKAIHFLAESYPDIARDPYSILIAITSHDMYTPYYDWPYLTNWRLEGRFAIVSTARLHPYSFLARHNPEWLNSRIQKLVTKNVALLYFDLPLSGDPSSLLSYGILTGLDLDQMSSQVAGVNPTWLSAVNAGYPGLTVYDEPGKPALWRREYLDREIPELGAQTFSTDLSSGLFIQRNVDFRLDEEYPFQLMRAYTTQDDRTRAFGIGAEHSLNVMLTGQMGFAVDLSYEDGAKAHFVHQPPQPGKPDTYVEAGGWSGPLTRARATFDGKVWTITSNDGWSYFFPFQPNWLPQYMTVLTSFRDPSGGLYKMERDKLGVLTSITTPSGKWLRFENDEQHRIRRIESSTGRSVRYEYDARGRLAHVVDSSGKADAYVYDDRAEMIAASREGGVPFLTMAYTQDGYVKTEALGDGKKFDITYFRGPRNETTGTFITDPRGLLTSFYLAPGRYTQSWSDPPPR